MLVSDNRCRPMPSSRGCCREPKTAAMAAVSMSPAIPSRRRPVELEVHPPSTPEIPVAVMSLVVMNIRLASSIVVRGKFVQVRSSAVEIQRHYLRPYVPSVGPSCSFLHLTVRNKRINTIV